MDMEQLLQSWHWPYKKNNEKVYTQQQKGLSGYKYSYLRFQRINFYFY